jgi:hypothetical protein
VYAAAHPEGCQRGNDAGEEDGAPAETRQDHGRKGCAQTIADGPEALHEGEGFGAGGCGESFGDERGAGGPLAAHAEAEEDTAGGEGESGVGEAAEPGGDGVEEHAGVESAGASHAVGGPTEEDAAGGGGEQRGGHHGAGESGGEVHLLLDSGQDHGVEHDVHAVEHPAESGCGEGAALRWSGGSEPVGGVWDCDRVKHTAWRRFRVAVGQERRVHHPRAMTLR